MRMAYAIIKLVKISVIVDLKKRMDQANNDYSETIQKILRFIYNCFFQFALSLNQHQSFKPFLK